jgi:hypothetical protein
MRNQLHDVTINQGKPNGKISNVEVTIDGTEIKGITEVNYSAAVDYPAKVTIEFYTGTLNVEMED